MRRVAPVAASLLAAAVVAVLGAGAGDGGGTYRVRAIFDSASFVVPGEDVKVAGVKVGTIDSLDVTPDNKAGGRAADRRPRLPGLQQDARCTIRPQSLIGEKFVACVPTQPRGAGAQPPPALQKIDSGDGEGQYLLPVANTRRRSTSTCSTTSCGCPSASASLIISTSSASASPAAARS